MLNKEESQNISVDWDRMFWSISQVAGTEEWSKGIEKFQINTTRLFTSLQTIRATFATFRAAFLMERLE